MDHYCHTFMSMLSLTNLTKRRLVLTALLASSVLPFASADAAINTFTDQGDFLGAFSDPSDYITETFSGLPAGDQSAYSIQFDNYPGSPVSFTVSTTVDDSNGLWKNDSDLTGGPWLGTLNNNFPLTISFGAGVRAVGAFFSLTDLSDTAMVGDLSVSINGGTPFVLTTVSSGTQPYLGFLSMDEDITTLEISTAEPLRFVSVSNVTVSPVPEPSSYVMLGASALLLLSLRARRRA